MNYLGITWERETRTFYYGLRIPLSASLFLYVPKGRKAMKNTAGPTCTVELKDLVMAHITCRTKGEE